MAPVLENQELHVGGFWRMTDLELNLASISRSQKITKRVLWNKGFI